MQSPWELGAIHRGAKWETINLTAYNSTSDVRADKGIGAYAEGDANILDQVKMTANTRSPAKVKLKQFGQEDQYRTSLFVLFNNVKVGQDYNSFGGGAIVPAAEIADNTVTTDLTSLNAATIYGKSNAPGGILELSINNKLKTRGCVAQAANLFNRTGQATDRTREEIIGKTINLTTVMQSDNFTAIVLAQTIRDAGIPYDSDESKGVKVIKYVKGAGIPGTLEYKFVTANGNLASPSNKYGGDTDVIVDFCQKGRYDRFADEIISEQKVLVEVYRDPISGKFRITRLEYMED
jgi:hypothetical protein